MKRILWSSLMTKVTYYTFLKIDSKDTIACLVALKIVISCRKPKFQVQLLIRYLKHSNNNSKLKLFKDSSLKIGIRKKEFKAKILKVKSQILIYLLQEQLNSDSHKMQPLRLIGSSWITKIPKMEGLKLQAQICNANSCNYLKLIKLTKKTMLSSLLILVLIITTLLMKDSNTIKCYNLRTIILIQKLEMASSTKREKL